MASPSIDVGQIITCRIWSTEVEQAAVCTVNYVCDSVGGTGGTIQQAANQLDTLIATIWKSCLNNNAVYNGVQVYVNQLPLPLPAVGNAGAGAGTGGATAMSRQTAGIIRWNTVLAGPAYRGRIYVPFPATADDAVGGIPSSGYLAILTSLAVALQGLLVVGTGGNTSGVTICIRHGKNKAGVTPGPTPVDAFVPVPKWATQKRRGSYGRANVSPI